MDMMCLPSLFLVTFIGLSEGVGVLQDDELNAAVGGRVMFTVSPTGEPAEAITSVIWTFQFVQIISLENGSQNIEPQYRDRINITSTGSLELRNLSLNDSGEYGVLIHASKLKTGRTLLNIYVPVSNVTAAAAGSTDMLEFSRSVRLSCSSSGTSLSFVWLNGSAEVTATDGVRPAGSTLTISNVTRHDQGPYRCHVFNPVSHGTSDPINLSISFGPETVNVTPSQGYHAIGSDVNLTCSAVSRPAPEFRWSLDGGPLPDLGPELRLMDIQMNQSGKYSCQAFNNRTRRSETSQPAVISVLEEISGVSVKPTRNQTIEGDAVNLTCEAHGSVFTRRWMKDGSDLTLTDNMALQIEKSVLSFERVRKTDGGEYSCNVANPVSHQAAKYVMVVNYGPENVQITGPSEIMLRQTITLTCTADSTPSAAYTWRLNSTEILRGSFVFTKEFADFPDSGNYTCQAVNNITGRLSSAVHRLSITVKPPLRCSTVCIVGIVIACCFVGGLCVAAGFCLFKRKIQTKSSAFENTGTRTRGNGCDNAAYQQTQDVTYVDFTLQNRGGRTVPLTSECISSDYAEVKVNNRPPSPSSPPSHDTYTAQMEDPGASSGLNDAQKFKNK